MPLTKRPVFERVQCGISLVPEGRGVFGRLTVEENLLMGAYLGNSRLEEEDGLNRMYEFFPRLKERRGQTGGTLSGGEQQMLTIARSLMGNPTTILLDEPSEGLAPVIVEQMANTIRELKSEGLTVVLSEQNLHFANLVSDRAYIIEKGRIRYEGTMEALAADEEVRQAYLTV